MKNIKDGKRVAIIDYGMGNINSVYKTIKLVNYFPYIVNNSEQLQKADYIILPGVGSFAKAYENLALLGLIDALFENVINRGKPFLGICLGMQILAEKGEEGGASAGLGWIKGYTSKIKPSSGLIIPHMGWDRINIINKGDFFKDIDSKSPEFYFCHSYALEPENKDIIIADFHYDRQYVAAIKQDNIYGCQFHPEKSQEYGKVCMENFLETSYAN